MLREMHATFNIPSIIYYASIDSENLRFAKLLWTYIPL